MSGWPMIVAASAVVFSLKLLGYLVPHTWLERPQIARMAALVTVALLAALVAVQTFAVGGQLRVDARTAGLAVAVVALLARAPFVVVVVIAAAVAAGLRALG